MPVWLLAGFLSVSHICWVSVVLPPSHFALQLLHSSILPMKPLILKSAGVWHRGQFWKVFAAVCSVSSFWDMSVHLLVRFLFLLIKGLFSWKLDWGFIIHFRVQR